MSAERIDVLAVMVAAVKAHALAHYNEGGWDYVVECWGDTEIIDAICLASAKTERAAIAAVAKLAGVLNDVREDVRGAGGCYDEAPEFPHGEFPPQANVGPLA